jgi:serine/threonine-protein kinase
VTDTAARLSAALAGRYRIERELGAGGMATVYLAHDEKHDRKVAIKVLHEDLGATLGPERFLAEIKTTAKLQHPHVLPLLDSGSTDIGDGKGGLLYYVMPFVEGESLRDRLDREKQLPIEDALRIAREVGDALSMAHGHGIIHRDIKPENILLQGGHALVADFGIALAVQHAGGQRMTQTGLSLGTPQYMSPEQAMGEKSVDARADIYALGAVTYEMLVGEPPFTGATVQAIVAKVLSAEPEPPTTMRKTIPPHVEDAVLTALAKLPADRFATVGAFTAALSGGQTSGARTQAARHGGTRRAEHGRAWAVAGATVGVFAGLAIGYGAWRGGPNAASRGAGVSRSYLLQPAAEVLPSGTDDFVLSPDGDVLAYVGPGEARGSTQLWVKRRSELHAVRLPGTDAASGPFFSPDGKWIAYSNGAALMKVAVAGGAPLTVASTMVGTLGRGAWIDGNRIVSGGRTWIGIVSPEGGRIDTLLNAGSLGGYNPYAITPMPGGEVVLVQACPPACPRSIMYALNLKTRQVQRIIAEARSPVALPTGEVMYTTASGELLIATVNASKLALEGEPQRIGEHVAALAVSRDGDIVYKEGTPGVTARAVIVDRDGREAPVDPAWIGWLTSLAIAPDQKRLATSILADGEQQIWLKQLPTGPLTKFTFGAGDHFRPTWSGDGSMVYYIHGLNGAFRVIQQRADGSGEAKPVNIGTHSVADVVASRDGKWLVMRTTGSDTTKGLLVMEIGRDSAARVMPAGNGSKLGIALSPDSKYIAFQSSLSGRSEVYVSPFPDVTAARWQVSRDGGGEPRWGTSGHALFFVSNHDELMSATFAADPVFHVTNLIKLRDLSGYVRDGGYHTYEPLPGDQQFMMMRRDVVAGPLVMVNGFAAEFRGKPKRDR